MKKPILFTILTITFSFFSGFSYGQIAVNAAVTPTQMVENLVGPGITYSNVVFTGDAASRGTFSNGNSTNLGMNSGVALTTGLLSDVPVNNSSATSADNSGGGIPELQALASTTLTDNGAILEFDFIPFSSNLNVRYIFGSEEYSEYVNTNFNDAFAFYISGPGITGQQNIALVPSTSTPVTINTINNGKTSTLSPCPGGSGNNGPCTNCAYYHENCTSSGSSSIEYDGLTYQLVATKILIPCSTYHIKLMIADGGDEAYDSGVFIEENGFYSSGAMTAVSIQPAYGLTSGVEGCNGSQFLFTMPNVLATNATFNYTVSGTATPGADYVALPTSVTIPAGQTSYALPINILNDAIAEGTETIVLTVQVSPCSTQTFTMNITDPTPINISSTNAGFCQGLGPVNISASTTGGNGTISYAWNNGGGNGSPISVNPVGTTTYTVTATDQCGRTNTSNSTVTVTPLPTSSFTATSPICQSSASTITYTGNAAAGATYTWSFGGGSASPGGTSQGPHAVTWGASGTYNLGLTVNSNGCTSAPSTRSVVVNPNPSTPVISSNSPVCSGGVINLTANTVAGVTYIWSGPNGFASNAEDPSISSATAAMAGTYSLYLIANGCTSVTASTVVNITPTPASPSISSNTPVCQNGSLNLTASTIAGATYVWSGPNGYTSSVEDPILSPATVAMSGTYTAYTAASGCTSAVVSTPVVVNPTPTAPNITSNTPICAGANLNLNSNSIVGATYVWSGPNSFSTGLEDPTITAATIAASGNYAAYVVVLGCTSATSTIPVTVNPMPTAPVLASNTPVCSGNTLNLTSNTLAGANYIWSGPNGFTSNVEDPSIIGATVAASGNYNAYVVAANCTSATSTIPVVVNPTPAAPIISSNTPVCSGTSLNLTANTIAGVTYVWSGPNSFTSNVEDPVLNPSTVAMAGTYSAYVAALGCTSATSNTTVVVNAMPAAPTLGSNGPICSGGALNLTSNTVSGATYVWAGPNSFASNLEDPSIASATTAASGSYSQYVVVSGCTSAVSSINVTVTALPVAPTVASNTPICENGSVNLTANTIANATYVWSGPNSFTSSLEDPTLTPATLTMAGNYTAYVVVSSCTSAVASTVVVVNPTPTAPVIASNTPVCEGAALNLTSNTINGATYIWSGPNAFSSSLEDPSIASATVAASGSYAAYVVVSGCTSAVSNHVATVNPIPAAPVITSNTPVCENGAINLSSNTVAGATYVWSGPDGYSSSVEDPSISPAAISNAGNYNAYVVVLGCTSSTATTPVAVNLIPAALTIGSNTPICENGNIDLTANTVANATYVWSGPNGFVSSSEDPTLAPATLAMGGNYSAYIVMLGCTSATANTSVVVNITPLMPVIASNGPLCLGETLNLTSNTVVGATYVWTGPNTYTSGLEDPSFVADDMNMGGSYSLYLAALGCTSATATTNVQVNSMPVADFAVTPQICLGDDAFALYNGAAPANATYDWVTADGTTSGSGQGPINITWNTAGAHNLTLTVTQGGCTSSPITHAVTIIAPVTPDAGPDQTLCSGATVNVGSQNMSGATFTWITPNGIADVTSAYTTGSWTNNNNNSTAITITLQSDNQGCLATDDAIMTIVPIPVASFNAPAAQCLSSNNFNFTAGGTYISGATFSWTFENSGTASSTSQNPTGINFTTPGSNNVVLTITQSGCVSAPFTLPITVSPGPEAAFASLPISGCIPLIVNFTNQSVSTAGGATYLWDFGHGTGSTQTSPSHTYTESGSYSVTLTVEDNSGCSSTVTQNNAVRVSENPIAGFYANPEHIYIDEPITHVHDASTGNVVSWDYQISNGAHFNVPSFMANFSDTGYYSITQTVSNEFGCSDVFTFEVHVLPVTEIFIPNAFTPDGNDNINATFKPSGISFDGYKMYIYNRWGEMLFSTADVNVGWDGYVRNSDVQAKQDLYVYKIEYVDHRGNLQEVLGNVMILR